jgi:membrane protein implicated in regulation of membrane protease activity
MLIAYTITGRRKWLIVAPNMIVLAVIGTAFVAILVGIALSLGFVLLITASLTCAIALVGWTVRSTWRTRPDRPNA